MDHTLIVRPNIEEHRLEIFREQENGHLVLYTHVNFRSDENNVRPFKEVAVQLGECLLLDIDMGRNLL